MKLINLDMVQTLSPSLKSLRNKSTSVRLAAGALGLLLVFGAQGAAQTVQSLPKTKVEITGKSVSNRIIGTVYDPNGAVVVGATITIQLTSLEKTQSVTSNDSGSFALSAVSPGVYTMTIKDNGFITSTIKDVKIGDGDSAQVTVVLDIDTSPHTEFIRVNEGPTILLKPVETRPSPQERSTWQKTRNAVTYPIRKAIALLRP